MLAYVNNLWLIQTRNQQVRLPGLSGIVTVATGSLTRDRSVEIKVDSDGSFGDTLGEKPTTETSHIFTSINLGGAKSQFEPN